jgi:non-ribosomal peptide synthetase-like protein
VTRDEGLWVALPGLLLIAYADRTGGPLAALAATPLAGLLFVLTTCVLVLGGKRAVLRRVRPGIYPVNSWFGLRKWIADKLMATSLTLTNTLYATLYTLPWLRALGAKIGLRSEVSTVSHIDPDLLTLGAETFVADIASIGAATFHNGFVALGRTRVGDRTFLGNASVIRSHTTLPGNCLIGVQSVAPANKTEPGTSWLGSPAIFLPKRQVCDNFAESLTYKPPVRLVAYRLLVEFFRIVLPAGLMYLLGTVVTLASIRVLHAAGAAALIALMPALYFASVITPIYN